MSKLPAFHGDLDQLSKALAEARRGLGCGGLRGPEGLGGLDGLGPNPKYLIIGYMNPLCIYF